MYKKIADKRRRSTDMLLPKITTIEELLSFIFKNRKFVRFLKEYHAFGAYKRLICNPAFRYYHDQTIVSFSNEIIHEHYFIVRAFPWNHPMVMETKISWGELHEEWTKWLKHQKGK